MDQGQNYKNHARIFPLFHIGALLPLFLYSLWAAYRLRAGITSDSVMNLLFAIAVLVLGLSARVMALRVQDRLICLEMQLRLQRILPADLHPRVKDLTADQLIGLRFASDGEMAELVRDVLAGKLASRKEIKMKIKNWQGDYLRA